MGTHHLVGGLNGAGRAGGVGNAPGPGGGGGGGLGPMGSMTIKQEVGVDPMGQTHLPPHSHVVSPSAFVDSSTHNGFNPASSRAPTTVSDLFMLQEREELQNGTNFGNYLIFNIFSNLLTV